MAAKREKCKQHRRRYCEECAPKLDPATHRWGPEINVYLTFVLHAIKGHLKQADGFISQPGNRQAIYSVARTMHELMPVDIKPIYRGLLIEKNKMRRGPDGTPQIGRKQGYKFVSWSEDRDVACWFADPGSFMNAADMTGNIKGDGWMVEITPRAEDILFHWTWGLNFPFNGRRLTFNQLARMTRDPMLAFSDFDRILRDQKEVMLKPSDAVLDAIAHKDAGCPASDVLNNKFHNEPPGMGIYLRNPINDPDTWAVIMPGIGGEFHRVDSLDYLYRNDTIVCYGMSRDTSWILYRRLKALGWDAVYDMSVGELRKLAYEVKNMNWMAAADEVKAIKRRDAGGDLR